MEDDGEKRLVRHILEAVAEHRLKAGTKLGEQALADIFACSRAHVRRALLTLAAQKVVELKPNRGAFVAMPSPGDARNVFQARRAIETTIARNAAARATPRDIARLRRHCAREHALHDAANRREAIRVSGQFHLILADICGNDVLTGFLHELILRSSLIIGLYAPPNQSPCAKDVHGAIVEALATGDAGTAIALTDRHLREIEAALDFGEAREGGDLRAIFAAQAR